MIAVFIVAVGAALIGHACRQGNHLHTSITADKDPS